MSKASAARQKIQTLIDARRTEQLLGDLAVLESQMIGFGTEEQRIVAAMISDTVEKREGLGDALEAVFMSEDWHGTYGEALTLAYAASQHPATPGTVTLAGAEYRVEDWSGETVLVSKRGTGYIVRPGISQPVSFPGGTPMTKRGNPVRVLNVGGVIEQVGR